MKKIILITATSLLLSGCTTIQFNVASNVNNVTVLKGQSAEKGSNNMQGSKLEDVVKDSGQKTDTDVTGIP